MERESALTTDRAIAGSPADLPHAAAAAPRTRAARRDFIDRLAQWIEQTPPYSWRAASIAAVSVALATLVRAASGLTGPDLRLVAYGPAILATGLLAGVPSAVGAAIVSCVIVYWAFTAPFFQFKWLIASDQIAFALFELAAGCTILLAHWCRVILGRLRRAQVTNEMIARELQHRGRNTFAILEVIVQKSLPRDTAAAADILGRMRAVQYANELLIKPAAHTIALQTLLEHEFVAFGIERLAMRGPPLELSAETARHLVLIFHELATNAAKYGALSNAAGRVIVTWRRAGADTELRWREQGGPRPEASGRQGFGSKLLAQCVNTLGGRIETSYDPQGLVCTLHFR